MLALVSTGAPEPHAETDAPATDAVVAPGSDRGRMLRARSWAAWVVTPLVAVLVGAGLDATDLVAPEPLGGASARYVPPDGHRSIAIDVAGVETITEHARAIGVEALLGAPPAIGSSLLAALGDEGAMRAQWWRSTTIGSDDARATRLHRLTPEGVSLAAVWGGDLGLVLEPELLLIPADARPGVSWSAAGSALDDGLLTYAADLSTWPADGPFADTQGRDLPLTGGCLGVDARLRIEEPGGAFVRTLQEASVWCPGRGIVWSSATQDDRAVGYAEVRPASLAAVALGAAPARTWSDAVGTGGTLTEAAALARSIDDPYFGAAPAGGQYAVAPASTPDGRLVMANDRGDDVEVWNLGADGATLAWAGHPGGTIVAVASVGDLVVATTSQRRVVAYDGAGRRLWSTAVDELVLAAPVTAVTRRAGTAADVPVDVVVATRGGTVVRLDGATGAREWSRSLGADARGALVAAGDALLIADERERITALDPATGAVLWRRDVGLVDRLAVGPRSPGSRDGAARGGSVIAAITADGAVILLADDGRGLSEFPLRGLATGLAVVEGIVVALTDERLVAIDATTQQTLWSAPGGAALAGEGSALAVVGAKSIALRSVGDGALVGEAALAPESIGATRSFVAVGPALVAADSDGALQRWALR